MNVIDFTKIMKILSASYGKDFDEETLQIWYMQFKDIKKDIFYKSINKIIRNNKFMPSIAEILEECEKEKDKIKFDILEKMRLDNYFKNELEYEKMNNWFKEGIIPSWFKEDMKKYYKKQLESEKVGLLNG